MSGLKYIPSLLPAVLTIAGNLTGGWAAGMNVAYTLVILVLVDLLSPSSDRTTNIRHAAIPHLILLLSAALHTLAIATLLYGIYAHFLTSGFVWLAAVSTGLNAGVSGITVAHELIHRKKRFWRGLGIWNLLLVNYSHFYVEHIRGHHARVGTASDPATARKGESVYRFFARTVIQQYKSALQLEANKRERQGRSPFGIYNFVLRYSALQTVLLLALWVFGGWIWVAAHLLQSLIAIFLLEATNYSEHYGLTREPGQSVTADHSWQSDVVSSRLTLIELSRHTDHHLMASKPYYKLESLPEGKFLPYGYFGMLYPLLIPPLWIKMVDPLLPQRSSG